jgi:hypothetical protein
MERRSPTQAFDSESADAVAKACKVVNEFGIHNVGLEHVEDRAYKGIRRTGCVRSPRGARGLLQSHDLQIGNVIHRGRSGQPNGMAIVRGDRLRCRRSFFFQEQASQ